MASNSIKYSVLLHCSIFFMLVDSTYNSLLVFTILLRDAYNMYMPFSLPLLIC